MVSSHTRSIVCVAGKRKINKHLFKIAFSRHRGFAKCSNLRLGLGNERRGGAIKKMAKRDVLQIQEEGQTHEQLLSRAFSLENLSIVYKRRFLLLISLRNKLLQFYFKVDSEGRVSLGVLDIFGFENFEVNR